MSDWTETNLGNILKFYNGKAIKALYYGKYPVYGSNGKIGFSNESKYCNSIIIGRVGAYCGSIYLEVDKYWASDNTIVADVKGDNNLKFIYFLLNSFPLNDLAGGSAQPLLNQSILSRIKLLIPPLKNQQKIAAILSTYDDLIENNKRRINLLEKMAEDIYREWFVRFRFPGWQNTDFDKGIPKGWELQNMREIISYYIGGGWGEDEQSATFSDGAYVIRGTDIPSLTSGDYSDNIYRYHKPSNLKSRKLQENDFIFEVSGGSKNQLLGRNLMLTKGLMLLCKGKI